MAINDRRNGRTWATDQLFTLTQASIYVVQWYELPAGDTSEIEVIARGKKFVRKIDNIDLEDEQRRGSLEQVLRGLAREIDEGLQSSALG